MIFQVADELVQEFSDPEKHMSQAEQVSQCYIKCNSPQFHGFCDDRMFLILLINACCEASGRHLCGEIDYVESILRELESLD